MKMHINMQDSLKKMVDARRASFETYDLDIDLEWDRLSGKLKKGTKPQTWKWVMSIAASLLIIGGFISLNVFSDSHQHSELSEAEFYYERIIDAKLVQVKSKVNDPVLLADIAQLDQAFVELKKDLSDNLDNEEVIMAMMENYQLKLRILERILQEIEEDEKDDEDTVGL